MKIRSWFIVCLFLCGCYSENKVKDIPQLKVYEGVVAAVVWNDGSVSLKEVRYEDYALSDKPITILSESYFHLNAEDVLDMSDEIVNSHWLQINYKSFLLNEFNPMIDVIKKILHTEDISKEQEVFCIYKSNLVQNKQLYKNDEHAIFADDTHVSLVKTYHTKHGGVAQLLSITAGEKDLITLSLQVKIVLEAMREVFK